MNCPACNADNPEQAKFCLECGTKLAAVCPQCGMALPPQAKFCFECGAKIGGPPPPPEPEPARDRMPESIGERLQRLVPKELAERMLAGKLEGERRIVTILFSDVKGSTAMAEALDPEDVMEIMDGAFDVLIEPIYRHEGTLARLMGDAILAFFGAPIAHEDDPARAIRAALEIVKGAQQYATRLEAERGIEGFNVRVGINTGLVVVGEVGSDLRVEYTAMGDAINLAARMEQAAPPGGILISHDTYKQVRGLFEVRALEPVMVKGKSEPVRVYLVQRAKPRAFHLETRGIEGIETRMIGREAELKRLQDTFYLSLEDRERQMVTISGEAGVGKSRLLYEFENWLDLLPEPVRVFRGRANQELQNVPYALLRDVFALQFQIQDSDPAQLVREKLEGAFCEILESERSGTTPQAVMRAHFVGQLLGFDFSTSPHLAGVIDRHGAGDARQLRDRALIYLGEFFRAATMLATTVILLEDIHWADDSSLDAINELALNTPDQPLLILSLARPSLFERRPHWGEGQTFHTPLPLTPLSKRDSRHLVAEILQKMDPVPTALRELVISGSEGNPLYVEELIKVLIEEKVIIKEEERWRVETDRLAEMRIPPTLTGVLQAHLDSLPLDQRSIVQQSAVVGRTFWDRVVVRIAQSASKGGTATGTDQANVPTILADLRDREIVSQRETSAFAQTQEFIFKHAALREVAYESILKRVRRGYHALVAEWLIEQSGERASEYTGLIAEHLELARQPERAVGYMIQAGEQAAAQFANAEAIDYFSRALELLKQVDQPAAQSRKQHYQILLGREMVYHWLGQRGDQASDLAALQALAEEMDGDRQRAEVVLRYAIYYESLGELSASLEAAQQGVQWAERAGDLHQEAQGLIASGVALWQQGKFDQARHHLEQALALAEEQGDRRSRAKSLLNLGNVSYLQGNPAGAAEYYEQALARYRDLVDRRGEALTLNNLVAVNHGLGDLGRARTCCQQALGIYQTIGDREGEARALSNLNAIHHALGDLQAAREGNERALALWQAIGDHKGEALASHNLGLVLHDLGDAREAQRHCQHALAINTSIGNQPGKGYSLTYLALALEALGEFEAAVAAYQEALCLRREIGQAGLAVDDLAGLARIALKQDRVGEARQLVGEIQAWIADHGVAGIEYPVRVYLTIAGVLAAAGEADGATAALVSARDWLDERAARISDEGTRRALLEQVPLHRELRRRLLHLS